MEMDNRMVLLCMIQFFTPVDVTDMIHSLMREKVEQEGELNEQL